jgi:hypothetical protein
MMTCAFTQSQFPQMRSYRVNDYLDVFKWFFMEGFASHSKGGQLRCLLVSKSSDFPLESVLSAYIYDCDLM